MAGRSESARLIQDASLALARYDSKWHIRAVMDEELELVLERVVATVHAKHGCTAEQLAVLMRISEDDMFDHLSELVISSRVGMIEACYYPIGATPPGRGRLGRDSGGSSRDAAVGANGARHVKPGPTVTYHRRA